MKFLIFIFLGPKYIAAKSWNLPSVGSEWVIDSCVTGIKADEKKYSIENKINLQELIDLPSIQSIVFKTFEKIRGKESDNETIMLILQIYEKASSALGPEEIGVKILPSIIPMMVTSNLNKTQFKEIMRSVRHLLERVE